MILEDQWNRMTPEQQTQACLSELTQMIWEAVREIQWLPLNDGTLVVQGFNTLVGRKEGDFPNEV
jgi:hypothetical protein